MALQINGIAINNTPFADGEAESLVQEIRRSLDREAEAATVHRLEDARRHRAAAENLYEQIQAWVGKRLAWYARRFFPDDVGLQEDVLVEMLARLRQRLLGDTARSHYFAEFFNDAVKMLSIEAFRCIARENGRSIKTGRPLLEFMSLNDPVSGEDNDVEDHLTYVEDPEALQEVERILDRDFARYAMRRLPSELHRAIFARRTRGDEWKAIARAMGVSVGTARTRYQEAKKIVTEVGRQFIEEKQS